MNYSMIAHLMGHIVLSESVVMIPALAVALIYGEQSGLWFLVTIAAAAALGFGLTRLRPKNRSRPSPVPALISTLAPTRCA